MVFSAPRQRQERSRDQQLLRHSNSWNKGNELF